MSNADAPVLAGIELGGTKCICILGTGPDDVRVQVEVPTTTPNETLARITSVLAGWDFAAVGIGSFGPLDLDPASPTFGSIINTTKPGWSGADLLRLADGKPFAIDTDVNAAALAEGRWGAAQGLDSWAYLTIGTGVGVGSIVSGAPVRGAGHSEAGHMRVPRTPGDGFSGWCRYHRDCVEGLASGPAIELRTGRAGRDIPADDPAWAYAADALTALCHNLTLSTLPQRILIGGGIGIGQAQMIPMIRERLSASLNGYGATSNLPPMEEFIVPPALGNRAGPLGSLALASGATGGPQT